MNSQIVTNCVLAMVAFNAIIGSSIASASNSPPLPSPLAYTSYQMGAVCQPSVPIVTPATIDDLVALVQNARATNTTVKAFGHRHSITDIICTQGTPVDMRNFRDMSFNVGDNTLTVGGGAYLRETCEFLEARGRALRVIPSFGGVTIGGALGTGAHGSSVKWTATISDQVVGLLIVDGLGNVRSITAEEDLVAFRVHLGLLGFIVNVTLVTVPLYKVRAHNYIVHDRVLTDEPVLNDVVLSTDQLQLFWFPSTSSVVVANYTFVDVSSPGNAYSNFPPPTSSAGAHTLSNSIELAQSLNSYATLAGFEAGAQAALVGQVPGIEPVYTENGLTVRNPATGIWWRMISSDCSCDGPLQCVWCNGPNNITFLDNEIVIGLSDLPAFISAAKEILAESPTAFPIGGLSFRFSGASNALMSLSNGRDSIHVHVEWLSMKRKDPYREATAGLAGYQAIMQTLLSRFGGRSHWGKSGLWYHSAPVLNQNLNPGAKAAFITKMEQFDPQGIFVNHFGLRLLGRGTTIDLDPLTKHCALLDNCICEMDSDCASALVTGQRCRTLEGFRVCKTPTLLP